ncbi:MAG: DMT family transporter [Heyndrickxia faecalis]|jgi:drug/metabolite transporter (DMT)-like permease|uniref:EamA domain-containing protein n=1 Tax=Heyndrickxia coagulans 36D1 TaxID=345219 RepID=G2TQ40_HEYCO|nr:MULTISPECIES: DMT family transporter [Heyndrickxia]NWN95922.1 DMT family transporter [Bacillus sp. (in: firmicutes)]AEO99688.1 protein of unknown function DUF6 transmembrane [Heyndrickxia coagulans 36D1]AVD55433.1 EamA/RhaT family transporter [Heyndrickxia coagulans]AWP36307.1 EamA/RhaT family transporter [Heyndrickxia coagulans]MCI1574642.1 DMT family transporter [Heyndrickxia coagulans]
MGNSIFQSIRKNKTGILLIMLAAFSTSVGQMLWKMSGHFLDAYFVTGFFLYFCGALLMIVAFRFGDLSVLHPLLSMGYIFSLFLGSIFLGEHMTPLKIIGTCIIFAGAALIGGGDAD